MVVAIGDEEVALRIRDDIRRNEETSFSRRASIAGETVAIDSQTGNGGNDPVRVHLADGVIVRISDVKIPLGIERNSRRVSQRCLRCRTAVSRVPLLTAAGDS